jgi:uncharacterized protein with ATP-grasp and redox domains
VRTYLECVPCFLRQALDAAQATSDDPRVQERVVRGTLRLVAEMPLDRPPPWLGQRIHRLLREATGQADPYREAKRRANDFARELLPELKGRVRASADHIDAALRVAIAGNIIDLGCRSSVGEKEIREAVTAAMSAALDVRAVESLKRAVGEAREILYIADNAGELFFDRVLIEELPSERVILAVRGAPVINDATREDVEATGFTSLARVIDSGSDAPGTILEDCSTSFRECFRSADVVIAKGQGNFETLSDVERGVFFLLKAKCPVVARRLGCELGEALLLAPSSPAGAPEARCSVGPSGRS